jgi:ankyrin repeat protein
MNSETIKEFFDSMRADDVFTVTTMLDQSPELANTTNEGGVTPLMFAHYYGKTDIINLLLQSGSQHDIFSAAAMGKSDIVSRLLAADPALLTAHAGDGWTALHLAVFFAQKAVAKQLLEAGANVLARSTNSLNNHPLHAAVAGRSRDCVAILLESGAEVNATQAGGWTALHGAAQNSDVEMTKVLLAHGANMDARADNNQTPLDLAMGTGKQELCDLLMPSSGAVS